jgi:hypothetical protein
MNVCRNVAPCSVLEIDQRFTSACCVYHQGDKKSHRPDNGDSRRESGSRGHFGFVRCSCILNIKERKNDSISNLCHYGNKVKYKRHKNLTLKARMIQFSNSYFSPLL